MPRQVNEPSQRFNGLVQGRSLGLTRLLTTLSASFLRAARNAIALAALLLPLAAQSEVFFERQNETDETGRRFALLMVLGTITRGDEVDFAAHLQTIQRENLRLVEDSVVLHSWGGNRWAAFDMGRLVRKKRLATLVPEDNQCDSACVWVLVGGVCRAAIGNIGIHRISFFEPMEDPGIEKRLALRDRELKRYLAEMDVPMEMWQVAHYTPTWGATYLSDIRKRVWGLFSTLPAEQERRLTAFVKRTGADKKDVLLQLRQRERSINAGRGEDADYLPVPCSEQLLIERPRVSLDVAEMDKAPEVKAVSEVQ